MTFGMELVQNRLHNVLVPLFSRSNEVIIRKLQLCGKSLPGRRQIITIDLRFLAFGHCGLLDLLPMLVQTREKECFLSETSPCPRNDVGNHFFVGMPQVRLAIDIINGGGDIKPFAHPALLWAKTRLVESETSGPRTV